MCIENPGSGHPPTHFCFRHPDETKWCEMIISKTQIYHKSSISHLSENIAIYEKNTRFNSTTSSERYHPTLHAFCLGIPYPCRGIEPKVAFAWRSDPTSRSQWRFRGEQLKTVERNPGFFMMFDFQQSQGGHFLGSTLSGVFFSKFFIEIREIFFFINSFEWPSWSRRGKYPSRVCKPMAKNFQSTRKIIYHLCQR